jgi:hypothetical protein
VAAICLWFRVLVNFPSVETIIQLNMAIHPTIIFSPSQPGFGDIQTPDPFTDFPCIGKHWRWH